jgi:hypothetical protein
MRYLLLAPLIALVVAGCGGADKNDYVKSLNKAQASLQKSLGNMSSFSSGDTTKIAATLTSDGAAIDKAADNLSSVKPPSDAKHAHGEIVDGLHKVAGTFRDAAKQAKANDLTGVQKTLTDFVNSPGAQEIQSAEQELVKNGYKVQGS